MTQARHLLWALPAALASGGATAAAFAGYLSPDLVLLLDALPFCGP